MRVGIAARSLAVAHDGCSATCDWRVAPRDPDTINFDTTLNGSNAKRHIVFGLYANSGDGLCLEHLGRLGLFAFVDLAIFAQLAAIVRQLDEADNNDTHLRELALLGKQRLGGSYNAASEDLAIVSTARQRFFDVQLTKVIFCHKAQLLKNSCPGEVPKAIVAKKKDGYS